MKMDEDIISRDPEIMNGALVFTGTRVPVEILIQHLTAGDSLDTFLEDFPTVTREQAVAYLENTLKATAHAPPTRITSHAD
ncbi:MAG: DUF433 domain-containing protein [bacterium]|nr:DUF433 domain-containing protein [bacterium]